MIQSILVTVKNHPINVYTFSFDKGDDLDAFYRRVNEQFAAVLEHYGMFDKYEEHGYDSRQEMKDDAIFGGLTSIEDGKMAVYYLDDVTTTDNSSEDILFL